MPNAGVNIKASFLCLRLLRLRAYRQVLAARFAIHNKDTHRVPMRWAVRSIRSRFHRSGRILLCFDCSLGARVDRTFYGWKDLCGIAGLCLAIKYKEATWRHFNRYLDTVNVVRCDSRSISHRQRSIIATARGVGACMAPCLPPTPS